MTFIKSNTSDRILSLSNRRGEWFTAKISGNPQVAIDVTTYADEYGLFQFFRKLAGFNTPWQGEITWSSLDR